MSAARASKDASVPFRWRCYRRVGEHEVVELGKGEASSWAEALRAIERAAGWDRRVDAMPPAKAFKDAIGEVSGGGRGSFAAV